MDFSYTEEQQIASESIIRFAQSLNNSDEIDGTFPTHKWGAIAEQGLLGLAVSEEWGGGGMDCVTSAIVLESLGYGCLDSGLVHAAIAQNLCAVHLDAHGSDEQKDRYLPRICNGELIVAQAITEPGAGSDTSALSMRAEKNDDGYVLNGSKTYISNGPIADVVIVYAVTNPERKVLGRTSCFLVPAEAAGLEKGSPMAKMGLDTLQNGELFFSDCRVDDSALLGRKGQGSLMFSEAMNWERVLLFASFVGKLQRIIELCTKYAKDRKQFGQPISNFQMVSQKIVDMKINYELAKLACYKAAWLIDSGQSPTLSAAICKLFASESCRSACLDAVQIFGGAGYMKETGIERELRDSIGGTIYSGTSEVQRLIIARMCGL